jgi:hypothetical protein
MAAIGKVAREMANRFKNSLAGGTTGLGCTISNIPDGAMLVQAFAMALGRRVTD